MNNKIVFVWAVLAAIGPLIVLSTPTAEATPGDAAVIADNQDFVWTFSDTAGATPTNINMVLKEFKDLNTDGDFLDAGERTIIVSITDSTSCAGNAHISCVTDAFGAGAGNDFTIIWRNASASHKVGNYTLGATLENAVGGITSMHLVGIRVVDPGILLNDLVAVRESLRDQSRVFEGNESARWQQQNNTIRNFELNESARWQQSNVSRTTFEGNESARWQQLNNTIASFALNVTNQHFGSDKNVSRWNLYDFGDNQDGVFVFFNPSLSDNLPVSFDLSLIRFKDDNNNGDLIGVEYETIYSEVGLTNCSTGVVTPGIFACRVDLTTPRLELVWKQASSTHIIGNYTMRFNWNLASGTDRSFDIGIRIHDPPLGGSTTTNQIITNPPSSIDQDLGRLVLVLLLIAMFTWAATRGGIAWPLFAMMGIVGLEGVILATPAMFTTMVPFITALGLPTIPFLLACANYMSARASRQAENSYYGE